MPTAVGPNTKGEENLVFGYDLGDVSNSYRGEPTVNLLYSAGSYNLIDGATDIYSNVTKTDLGNGKYRFVNDGTGVTTIRVYTNEADLIDGETYAVSVYYEDLIGTISIDWCDQTVSGNNSSTETSGRLSGTASRSSYTDPFYFLDINLTNGGAATIYNPQVEYKSHVTPFVAGTRSATQGLIDITGNSTIDLTNVSFDSNAQMTFDGSNDSIYINDTLLNVDAFTVEAVVNITSEGNYNKPIFVVGDTSTAGIWFFKHRSGLGNRLVMHGYDGVNPRIDVDSVNQVPDAVNTYVAVTFDGNAYQLYMNGEPEDSPVVDNKVAVSTDNYIGRQSSTYLAGEIPALKVYNRALTPSEIKANYNAIKGRFNI